MTEKRKAKTIKRKSGNMIGLMVEIDATQFKLLDEISLEFKMTKRDIISQAINCWISLSGIRKNN